jgi:biotin carboxylase
MGAAVRDTVLPEDAAAGDQMAESEALLVLGSGDPVYRDYALRALAECRRVLLVESGPITWQSGYVIDTLDIPPGDQSAVLEAVRSWGGAVRGITTYSEFCVESAAVVAARLGLRFVDPGTARRCRDKSAMRVAFAVAGVPSAQSIAVQDAAAAAAAARRIGYPVVLKPPALAGSIGVVRVDAPEELAERFAVSSGSGHAEYGRSGGVTLVEEFLDGPEVSVEAVVQDGEVTPVAVTRKRLGPAPFFEETGHVVAPAEPLQEEAAVLAVARAAHVALGVRWGITHTEVRLTASGPRVVELAVRAAGDLIPCLVRLSTGVDLMRGSALVATGERWWPTPRPQRVAGIRFFYPPYDLKVDEVSLDVGSAPPAWLRLVRWEVEPGTELRLPPRGYLNRLGYAVVTADTRRQCDERLDSLEPLLRVSGTAL